MSRLKEDRRREKMNIQNEIEEHTELILDGIQGSSGDLTPLQYDCIRDLVKNHLTELTDDLMVAIITGNR